MSPRRRTFAPRLIGYVALGAAGGVLSILLRRPELLAVAAAPLLVALIALVAGPRDDIEASLTVDRERILEQEPLTASITLLTRGPATTARIGLAHGSPLSCDPGMTVVRLEPGVTRELTIELESERWGVGSVGPALVSTGDPLALASAVLEVGEHSPIRVYPRRERLANLLAPWRTQRLFGSLLARERGDGLEFAELRPYVSGDLVRRIDWRATARTGRPIVSERHPERNADVVLFLDTYAEVGDESSSTLVRSVAAATTLAAAHLARRDRVGVIGFGTPLRWLEPRLGVSALARIADTLIESAVYTSYTWRDSSWIPRRMLPSGVMLIALSPLLDERTNRVLVDLCGRGHDVVIVELEAERYARPPRSEVERVARALWPLHREALRARYRSLGIPVTVWREDDAFAVALEEVSASRRMRRSGRG